MSPELVTSIDLNEAMIAKSRALDDAHEDLVARARQWAEAERDYRKAIPAEWLRVRAEAADRGEKLLAEEAKARVQDRTADARFQRDVAGELRVAALELVRTLRAQLNAYQSIGASVRVEAELAGRYQQTG
jgi:hypothetical protein